MLENYLDVDSRRNYLFLASYYAIQVFDVSDPIAPQLVQFVPMNSTPYELEVKGDYLYVSMAAGMGVFYINLPPVACGDANADGSINTGDAVYLINYIFRGGPPPVTVEEWSTGCGK